MITKPINTIPGSSLKQVAVPAGASTTTYVTGRQPLEVTSPVMNTVSGPKTDYIRSVIRIEATMPAGTLITLNLYRGGKFIGTTTNGALGASTNTTITDTLTHALIQYADEYEVTYVFAQNVAYNAFVVTVQEEIVYPSTAEDLVDNINISIGTEALDVIPLTVQLFDEHGAALAERVLVKAWLSTDANGTTVSAVTSDTIAGGAIIAEPVAHGVWDILTSATGAFVLSPLTAAVTDRYLTVSVNGKKWTSAIISWA